MGLIKPLTTVATAVFPLYHAPPPVPSDKLIVDVRQTLPPPLIGRGKGFTVSVVVI